MFKDGSKYIKCVPLISFQLIFVEYWQAGGEIFENSNKGLFITLMFLIEQKSLNMYGVNEQINKTLTV